MRGLPSIQKRSIPGHSCRVGPISSEELSLSVRVLVRFVQHSAFASEIRAIAKHQRVHSDSNIKSLNPFLDQELVLRVGGRLDKANIAGDKKFPILLPRRHSFTNLVILSEHLRLLHGGPQAVQSSLSARFWILNSRDAIRRCWFYVLDEADGLLKAGYTNLINQVHQQIPKVMPDEKRLQMIICSGTLHDFDHVPTDGVHQQDNVKPGSNTAEALSDAVKRLKGEYCVKAIDALKMDRALFFYRTKIDCDNLETYLNQIGGGARNSKNPYTCVCLHGDRKPPERKANLEKFENKQVKFLICTDVAARGIDVSGLPFMINVTLPDEKSNYVNRIGRVGRAERMGLAYPPFPKRYGIMENGYNESPYLTDIHHLNITIAHVGTDMDVPCDEFDWKVVYGKKKAQLGSLTPSQFE
ncbi:unnamed protein product [Allacma fusca]|uniref:Helicase C-terminal domain-containing protein n=1 Tax=Allacma fusca TaxID=39272 RepID=A0A8J2NIL0_9HEXA|nr:unnamed protein product [Allacma fusca]